jgi:hypothetical protein
LREKPGTQLLPPPNANDLSSESKKRNENEHTVVETPTETSKALEPNAAKQAKNHKHRKCSSHQQKESTLEM